ncbi:hypothetical protein FKM82_013893 [Ascaphus truei]
MGINWGDSLMEKDLGVLVGSRLSNNAQSHAVAAKEKKILSCIKRAMDGMEVNIMKPLYKALLRPYLEYGIQFWAPLLRKDIMELEGAEKRDQINKEDGQSNL